MTTRACHAKPERGPVVMFSHLIDVILMLNAHAIDWYFPKPTTTQPSQENTRPFECIFHLFGLTALLVCQR